MKHLKSLTLILFALFCFSCNPDDAITEGTSYSNKSTENIKVNEVFATEGEEEAPPAEKERDD